MIDSLRSIEAILPWILGFTIAGTLLLVVLVALKLYDLFAPLGELPPGLDAVHVKLIHKTESDGK